MKCMVLVGVVVLAFSACKSNDKPAVVIVNGPLIGVTPSQGLSAGTPSNTEPSMKATVHSKADIAALAAKKYATEAYPLWQTYHAGHMCPDKLDDLNEWADSRDGKDPWGTPFEMVCGADAPPAAKGFGVWSAGEDRKKGTADDIKSWE